jgi:hypothetical protein
LIQESPGSSPGGTTKSSSLFPKIFAIFRKQITLLAYSLPSFFKKTMLRQANKTRARKKREVQKRVNRLDPNNNKNLPGKPLIRRRGKKVSDDGFEHRLSKETAI